MPLRDVLSSLKFIPALALGLIFFVVSTAAASAQSFNKSFSVDSDSSSLEVTNQTGSIKVTASPSNNKIVINAKQASGGDARIEATQNKEGKVTVEVAGRGTIDFDITVPSSTKLNLYTYKGTITVVNPTGRVRARISTDGNINFSGIRSSKVEAHSATGNILFNGETKPDGEYTLKSFSGRVEVTVPSNCDFSLSASSISGVMDFGGFPMKFNRQNNQQVEAVCGSGRAKVIVWTQEGSIHLRRKQ